MIWDLHCHLTGVPGRTPDEIIAGLMEYADRMGIDRLVFYLGLPPRDRDPSPQTVRRENDEVLQALSHWHHRAFGFVYLNPKHVEFSLKELDRCVRDGPMVGIKLWVAHRCHQTELDPIVRRAMELKAVVFQHTWLKTEQVGGNYPGESTPMNLAELAGRHPGASIICGHAGGDWERGIRAIRSSKNVALGLGGFDPTAGVVEMAVRELGPDRVIYGSDIGGRSFASQLAKVKGAEIPQAHQKLILGKNLWRLLAPILKDKGRSIRD